MRRRIASALYAAVASAVVAASCAIDSPGALGITVLAVVVLATAFLIEVM